MTTLVQDVRFAGRLLLKSPGFTLAAIVTLALGIGATTAIFSVVEAVLLNALPYRQPDRLVTLAASEEGSPQPVTVSYMLVQDWKERSRSFQSIAMYRDFNPTLGGEGKPEMLQGIRVSSDFFRTLGVTPALGRDFTPEEDRPGVPRAVLLTHAFWQERFAGSPGVVGRTIALSDIPYLVVGVLPSTFQPLIFSPDHQALQLVAPLAYDASLEYACRSCQHLHSVARIADGVSLGQAREEMAGIAGDLAREFPRDYPPSFGAAVQPLRDRVVGRVRSALWLLLGATGFVLSIACANTANLLLARAAVRRREMSIRAALGATSGRLARQWLTETCLLTLIGGAAGVLLAVWGVSAFTAWAPAQIPRLSEIQVDAGALIVALALSLLSGLLAGLVPAAQAAKVDQREALQSGRGIGGSAARPRFRRALLITQVALAFLLVAGTGLLIKSLGRVLGADPGFETRDLYTARMALLGPRWYEDAPVVEFERRTLERIGALPGVEAAAIVTELPLGGSWDRRGFHIQDRRPANDAEAPSVLSYYVSPDYFRAMKIPLVRGRAFTEADMARVEAPVALISEATARQIWPDEDPMGKRIQLGGRDEKKPWAEIVGIVGDVRQFGLETAAMAGAYLPYTSNVPSFPILVVRSGLPPEALRSAIEESVSALDRGVPVYRAASMERIVSGSVAPRRFMAAMVGGFGALALLLAGLGLYGVLAYLVAQRSSETGIRMALGASRGSIFRLFVREGMEVTLLGLAIGIPAALALARVLGSQLYEVRVSDPFVLGGAAAVLAASALAACWAPARRATRADPMTALRCE